jgi:hypothetical protein
MAPDKELVRQLCEERGIKTAAPDHWIYSEGASATLIPTAVSFTEPPTAEMPAKRTRKPKAPPPPAVWNSTAIKLRDALKEASRDGESISGDDVPDYIELEDTEAVEWVASTYIEPDLINLFVCRAVGEPETVLSCQHGSQGSVDLVDGPWATLKAAKTSFGRVREGWSDL